MGGLTQEEEKFLYSGAILQEEADLAVALAEFVTLCVCLFYTCPVTGCRV